MKRLILLLILLASPALAEPWSQADRVWGAEAMARARETIQTEPAHAMLKADRLEMQFADGEEIFAWDLQGWVGYDLEKIAFKSEGEYVLGEGVEAAEAQVLWRRAITRYFDIEVGLRGDAKPAPRIHAALGITGLLPQWVETDATLFVSNKGELTARIEAETDWHLTRRLVLQPRFEIEFAAQDSKVRKEEAGVTGVELGTRLSYGVTKQIAPYVGFDWHTVPGEGGQLLGLAGIRAWF